MNFLKIITGVFMNKFDREEFSVFTDPAAAEILLRRYGYESAAQVRTDIRDVLAKQEAANGLDRF